MHPGVRVETWNKNKDSYFFGITFNLNTMNEEKKKITGDTLTLSL